MRLRLTAALMMLCVLFSSCSAAENGVKDALSFRSALAKHGGCTYTARITTSIAAREYSFTLSCRSTDMASRIEVTEPDTIAGVMATVTETDSCIEFDGISLEFGKLDDALRSPLYAPTVFAKGWFEGYIDGVYEEGDALWVTYRIGYDEEELLLKTRMLGGTPAECELYRGEQLLLFAAVEDFTFLT